VAKLEGTHQAVDRRHEDAAFSTQRSDSLAHRLLGNCCYERRIEQATNPLELERRDQGW